MWLLIEMPGVSCLIGAGFVAIALALALVRRTWCCGWSLAAGVAWLAYWMWEVVAMRPSDNIRVDLLMIYPVLGVLSFLAILTTLVRFSGPVLDDLDSP